MTTEQRNTIDTILWKWRRLVDAGWPRRTTDLIVADATFDQVIGGRP